LVPDGKKRLTVNKIKNSPFFAQYIKDWNDVEQGKLECKLRLDMRDPQNEYQFDEICYDSDDADFQHEYEQQQPPEPSQPHQSRVSMVSCDSTYYNKLEESKDELQDYRAEEDIDFSI
jgi:hypothetical protein